MISQQFFFAPCHHLTPEWLLPTRCLHRAVTCCQNSTEASSSSPLPQLSDGSSFCRPKAQPLDPINAEGSPKATLNKHHSSLHTPSGVWWTLVHLPRDMRKTEKAPSLPPVSRAGCCFSSQLSGTPPGDACLLLKSKPPTAKS